MKDGTPLLEEEEPKFIAMPSESIDAQDDDDPGEVTVVRRNIPVPKPPPVMDENDELVPEEPSLEPAPPPEDVPAQRIVVPTATERPEPPRARVVPYQPPPSQRPNTFLVVLFTMFGTITLLGIGAAGFWLLTRDRSANTNLNANANLFDQNLNVNTNLGADTNFNFNLNANFNTNSLDRANMNSNANANVRTPTPTPTQTPSPSPTPTTRPSPDETPDADETPVPRPTRPPDAVPSPTIIRPGTSPTPRTTPAANRPVNRSGNNLSH